MEKKHVSFSGLAGLVAGLRGKGGRRRIVLCHGCFDIVHPGHIRHLRSARDNGDILVVSITPDSCVNKGVGRPFVPQDLRVDSLSALQFVDYVTVAPADTALEVIEAVRPDVYVKGNEYVTSNDPRFQAERRLVCKLGGKVVYTSGDVVYSSSDIIRSYNLDAASADKINFLCAHYKITRSLLNGVIENTQMKRILVVGEPLLDEFRYCQGLGISHDSPVLSLALKRISRSIGGAGLIASHFASLGVKVVFLTSFKPDDPAAGEYTGALEHLGVTLVNVEDPQRKIVLKTRFVVGDHNVLKVEDGAYLPLDSELRLRITAALSEQLESGIDCMVYSDFGYGMLPEDIIIGIAAAAERRNILVVGDISTSLRTQIGKFYNADIFVPSEMELRSCFHDYESGLSVLVDRFYQVTNVKELYMTLADRSSLFFRRPPQDVHIMETAHFPPLAKQMANRLGLDDAFLVGVTLGRLQGCEQVQSLYLGAACSAVQSLKSVNTPLAREDLHRFLDDRSELRN